MPLAEIRASAECFRKVLRRQNLFAYLLLTFLVAAFGWIAFTSPNLIARAGACLFILGCLYCGYQVYTRGGRRRLPENGLSAEYLNFYLSELELLRDFHNSVWSRLFALVPGYTLLLVGLTKADPQTWRQTVAIGCAFLAFGVIGLWLQRHLGRRVQRQIDALSILEKPQLAGPS